MSHLSSSLLIICGVLCWITATALAQASTCPCTTGTGAQRCRDGRNSELSNDENSYASHNHDSRGLYGDCLPQVNANEAKCFKWKVKSCGEDEPELCRLISRNDVTITGLPQHVQSPRFEDNVYQNKTFGERYFCVYNVSMNCLSGSVDISATNRSTWPNRANWCCYNYIAFYSNSSHQNPDYKYCGNGVEFDTTLQSDSFIAVMWSDEENNYGAFEFDVSCSTDSTTPAPTDSM